jgi:hypothetical protein
MARARAEAGSFLQERSADVVALQEHRRKHSPPTSMHGLPAAG